MSNTGPELHSFGSKGIKEAIFLAGGLGTRLRPEVPDLPKCMAPVKGKPFLAYLVDHYMLRGIEKFIFSLGYKHEIIESFLNDHYGSIHIEYSVEEEPLGTGGAIQLACAKTSANQVLVLNGDTFFNVELKKLFQFHLDSRAACTIALKPMHDLDRYGTVLLGKDDSIVGFLEKKPAESGLINGGVYLLEVESLLNENLPRKFSFEKDYLEKYVGIRPLFGQIQQGYFIDIGVPEDFRRAQTELIHHL
jgi:D-glycero-alpha-D-manno-heptose 1-phosphate guanylyltransferase